MIAKFLKSFLRDRRGNVAIIFALTALPALAAVGVAVDFGRIQLARTKMQNAADAAVVYAATKYNKSESERIMLAQDMFDANGGNLTSNISVTTNIQFGVNTLKLDATAAVPTTFMALMDIASVDVGVTSTVSTAGKKLELSVMLDTTGSMQGQKLTDLKVALTEMLDIVMPAGNTNSKVAFVPFAATVNVGTTNTLAMTGRTSYPTKRCVYERKHGPRPNEVPPTKPNSEFWISTNNSTCSSIAPIVPLTSDRSLLDGGDGTGGAVAQLIASGSTAGHSGTAWTWHMISPLWAGRLPPGSAPAAYTDAGTIKAIVLMTDGVYSTLAIKENGSTLAIKENGSGGGCNGQNACQPSLDEAKAYCKAIKEISKTTGSKIPGYSVNSATDVATLGEQAILIFSVGFGLPAASTNDGAKARDVMTHCASYDKTDSETNPNLKRKHYYFPVTGEDIRNAFADIGRSLSEALNKPRMIN